MGTTTERPQVGNPPDLAGALPGQLSLAGLRACPHCGSSNVQVSRWGPSYFCLDCELYDGAPDPAFRLPRRRRVSLLTPGVFLAALLMFGCGRDVAGDDQVDAGVQLVCQIDRAGDRFDCADQVVTDAGPDCCWVPKFDYWGCTSAPIADCADEGWH